MRTLYDILEAAKDGGFEAVTHDECYHAMIVLVGLCNLATSDVRKAAEAKPPFREIWANEAHNRYRQALNVAPDTYLGKNVPGNAEYDRFRAMGKRLVDRAIEEARDG